MNELKIKKSLQFELTKEQQNELDKTGFIQLNKKYSHGGFLNERKNKI